MHALVNILQSFIVILFSCNHDTPPKYVEVGTFQYPSTTPDCGLGRTFPRAHDSRVNGQAPAIGHAARGGFTCERDVGGKMDRPRSTIGALLATSSVVAMIAASSTPAYAVCTTIGNSGLTNPTGTTIPCAIANNATITGNVVNAGTITPGQPFGIKINGGT